MEVEKFHRIDGEPFDVGSILAMISWDGTIDDGKTVLIIIHIANQLCKSKYFKEWFKENNAVSIGAPVWNSVPYNFAEACLLMACQQFYERWSNSSQYVENAFSFIEEHANGH